MCGSLVWVSMAVCVCVCVCVCMVQVVLEELQLELDSAELLPGNRLSEVGSMVTQLESLADSNQLTIDTLQDQVM